mmetsp:Transcript_21624/g.32836  ORF Transcript_21624/g.32836 Transcript_21624/m.32836 type:complete len:138 (+) Transcript_21624:1449-1862(+)
MFAGRRNIRNANDKRNQNIAAICFIVSNILNLGFIAVIIFYSTLTGVAIIQTNTNIDSDTRGNLACLYDGANSCTCCECSGHKKCPEWTSDDVENVLRTQTKASIVLASILLVYAISTLRYGFQLKRQISMYQIDYV